MVIHGYRSVFMVFKVPGCFCMVPGPFNGFLKFPVGPSWFQVGFSWFQVGFQVLQVGIYVFSR